jgi:3-hydroxyisobutyrate dehydrogenase-like beta-hydroxyacid dehydrogenase
MAPIIVVIAAGEMGAAVGQRLRLRGATVRTSLRGRSAATKARAEAAGLIAVDDDIKLVEGADFVLSIMPPGEAKGLALRLVPALGAQRKKPVYVDCNAVAPATVRDIARVIMPAGCSFADIGILGGPPPKDGDVSPRLYVSGDGARRCLELKDFGLDIRLMEGVVGEASAVKMGYACLTKGTQAIGAAMMLGAMRNNVAPAVKDALSDSLPEILNYDSRQMPRMFPKAYRWVAEMEEISKFLEASPGASQMLAGAAKLYAQIAEDFATHAKDGTVATIDGFLKT